MRLGPRYQGRHRPTVETVAAQWIALLALTFRRRPTTIKPWSDPEIEWGTALRYMALRRLATAGVTESTSRLNWENVGSTVSR